MDALIYILLIISAVSTLVPLLKHEHWMIRFFDFPYVQFTIFQIIFLVGVGFWYPIESNNYWLILIGLAISITFRLFIIFPYTVFSSKSIPTYRSYKQRLESAKSIKIITSNVLMYNSNYQGLVDIINSENPDLLLLVETDSKWKEVIHPELKLNYPYSVLHPLENTYGLLFYSKLKLSATDVKYLVQDDVPSIDTIIHLEEGSKIRFFGIHPKPPAPSENETSLPRDVELIKVGRKARNSELPVIVTGDLNDVAWSHTTRLFMRVSGLLDPRIGRGFFNTYPANYPFSRWPLDHFFLSYHFKVVNLVRLNNYGSDHFPICAEVILEPSLVAKENVEHPTHQDKEEANQKLEQNKS